LYPLDNVHNDAQPMSVEPPPILGYAMPGILRRLKISDSPQELLIIDSGPPVYSMVLSWIVAGFWLLVPIGIAIGLADASDVAIVIAAVCAIPGLLFTTMAIDDVVKRAKPASIAVHGEILHVTSYSWLGRSERVEPLDNVKDILIAVGSPTVHAWNSLVFRFHRGQRLSVLRCRDKYDLSYTVSLLRQRIAAIAPPARLSGGQSTS
jgi:hypothetical protein